MAAVGWMALDGNSMAMDGSGWQWMAVDGSGWQCMAVYGSRMAVNGNWMNGI